MAIKCVRTRWRSSFSSFPRRLVEGKPSSVRDEFIDDERSIGRDLARDSVRINDVKLKKKRKKTRVIHFLEIYRRS